MADRIPVILEMPLSCIKIAERPQNAEINQTSPHSSLSKKKQFLPFFSTS